MKKVVYIIPGFNESAKSGKYKTTYKKIASFFKSQGIRPIFVEIQWKYKTMSGYVHQFMEQYKKEKDSEIYLFGFSYGAMISLIVSPEIKPKLQILSSLSPYFKEDIPYLRKWWKRYIGKKRLEDHRKHSFNKLIKNINCKTLLIIGSQEEKEIKRRVEDARKKLKGEIIIAKGAKHNIRQKEYLETLQKVISKL